MLMTNHEVINKAIVDYVAESFFGNERANIPLDLSLVEEGIVDSFGIIELVAFLESQFDITVEDEDITNENFGSINKMTDYILNISQRAS